MASRREVTREPQIIKGFKAFEADNKLYRAVAEGSVEKFGKNSQAYKTVMNGIDTDKGTGSQYFFNTEAGLYLPQGQRVAKYNDLGEINDTDPSFFNGIYTDTPELVLRTATPSWKNNTKILENLVKQVKERGLEFSSENPLILSNLNLVRDDNKNNPYGILLEMNDSTIAENDQRFAYGKNEIQLGNQPKTLWTKENGLSWVYFSRNGYVDSDIVNLQNSDDYGRVAVVDAEGVSSENSEFETIKQKYHSDLSTLRDRINVEIGEQDGR